MIKDISLILIGATICSHRLKVRTQDFHSCNTGSIPVESTIVTHSNNYLVKNS